MSCYYCERNLTDVGGTRKTIDHIIPITLGGVNRKINLIFACQDCNSLKGSKTLQQFINKVQKAIRREKKLVNYTTTQLKKIIENSKSLIENCVNVYQKQLFIDKYHWEDYQDRTKYYQSQTNKS